MMSDKLSFKVDLWDGFTPVTKNSNQGIQLVKEVYGYFKKRALIEEEYAKNLTKLHQKVFKNENDDSAIGSTGEAWDCFERAAQSEGLVHQTLANNLTEQVISPTKRVIIECDERLKALHTDGQRIIADYHQSVKNLDKAKSKYRKMCSDRDAAKLAFDEATQARSKQAGNLEKRVQAATLEADEAEAEYRAQIEQTNQFQTSYLTVLMPRIMEELEKLELYRSTGLRDNLKVYNNLLAALPSREAGLQQPVTIAVNAINPDGDLQLMIKRTRTDAKKPAPFSFEKDDVVETNNESRGYLQKGKSLLARKLTVLGRGGSGSGAKSTGSSPVVVSKNSIFGMKLEDLMKRQDNTAPNIEIPLPLVALAWAMLKLDAPHTEGVFRVPAPASELAKLTKQLEESNYDFDTSVATGYSVHSLAACFKKILRDLPEPLVPQSVYNTCIDTASNGTSKESVAILYSNTFPPQNLILILFIVRFLQEFLHPDAVAASKMNADNVAMVFAPSLLKTMVEDLNLMVANVNHEKVWVRHLLESLPLAETWKVLPPQDVTVEQTDESRVTLAMLQNIISTVVLNPAASTGPLSPPYIHSSVSPVDSPMFSLSPAFRAVSPINVSGNDVAMSPPKSDSFMRNSSDGKSDGNRSADNSFLSMRRVDSGNEKHDSFLGDHPRPDSGDVSKWEKERDQYKDELARVKEEAEREKVKALKEKAAFEQERQRFAQERVRADGMQQKVLEIEQRRLDLEKLVQRYQAENEQLKKDRSRAASPVPAHVAASTDTSSSNTAARLSTPGALQSSTPNPASTPVSFSADPAANRTQSALLPGQAPNAAARARSPSDPANRPVVSSTSASTVAAQPTLPTIRQSPPPNTIAPVAPTSKVSSFTNALPAAAKTRDLIVAEMNFLANRISNTVIYNHVLDLSKCVRTIKLGLDGIIQSQHVTDAEVSTYSALYYGVLPRPTASIVTDVPENPDIPDLDKIRKMRPVINKTMGIILDTLAALVVLNAQQDFEGSEAIQTSLDNLVAQLPKTEEHIKALRVEAGTLCEEVPGLIACIKENFPNTPANLLVELARPILSLMKDMDSFFATQGLTVPVLGNPPVDDASITDERMRRVRSMLFMSLDKIHAQAHHLVQAAEDTSPSNNEAKITEYVMRLHTIIGVLESDS